ncbi:MAG: hypothetical protein ACFHX7_11780 [Pseudomonadota bacterium]
MDLDPCRGYSIGQIDLPEGLRVQSIIDGDQKDFNIGTKMRVAPNVISTDKDGNEYRGFNLYLQQQMPEVLHES